MAAYRHIHIDYWQDSFVLDLTPEEKYFYIYLMTNSKTTQCGVYSLHNRIIETETGYNRETVEKLIQRFIEYKKIYYCEETKEIYLVNWIKKEIENIKNKEFVKLLYKSFEELGYNIENGENNHGKYNKEYRESKHAKSLKNENDKTYKSTANDELEQLRKKFGGESL